MGWHWAAPGWLPGLRIGGACCQVGALVAGRPCRPQLGMVSSGKAAAMSCTAMLSTMELRECKL